MTDPIAPEPSSFEQQATQPTPSLAAEFLDFLKESKKWWLLPILLSLAILIIAALLLNTAAAPFIYTLF